MPRDKPGQSGRPLIIQRNGGTPIGQSRWPIQRTSRPQARTYARHAYLRTSSATNVGADKDSDRRQREAIAAFASRAGYELVSDRIRLVRHAWGWMLTAARSIGFTCRHPPQ
jgi:hypothetical protein